MRVAWCHVLRLCVCDGHVRYWESYSSHWLTLVDFITSYTPTLAGVYEKLNRGYEIQFNNENTVLKNIHKNECIETMYEA